MLSQAVHDVLNKAANDSAFRAKLHATPMEALQACKTEGTMLTDAEIDMLTKVFTKPSDADLTAQGQLESRESAGIYAIGG